MLGGAIAAIALLAFRSSPAPSAAAAKTVVETVVQTSAGTPSLPPVTRAEMQHDLLAYAQAFSAENTVALEGLFAPGLRRQSGNGPVEDLNGAIADYQHQFAGLTSPRYVLSDVGYTTGRGEGFAVGRYAITSAEGVSRGRIGFRFVVQGGFVLIDRIRAIPS